MKKVLTITFLFFAFASYAQEFPRDTTQVVIDSSKIMVPITLKSEYHYLIIDCLEGVAKSDWADYANQVAKAMDTSYNATKPITVTLSSGTISELFFQMSAQQERISAVLNKDLRGLLLPQLSNYSWLYRELQSIQNRNNSLILQRKMRAFNLLKQIR